MSDDLAKQGNLFADGWAQVFVDPDLGEAGGEHANEGIDFARYWAVALLIERELAGQADYAILFEYLQDVALLNSASCPTEAVLYQVKKKERGGWSRSELCKKASAKANGGEPQTASRSGKRKKLTAASSLGKLYLCIHRLSEHVYTSGIFLSNAPISLRLVNGELIPPYSKVCLSQLMAEDFTHIEKTIASELKMVIPLPKCTEMHLEQTKIAPAAMRETVRGILGDYLQTRFPTVPNVSGQLVERLMDSFSKKSGPQPAMANLSDIVIKKGFTRSDFTKVIEQASSARAFSTRLDQIADCLQKEGFPSRQLNKIRDAANRHQTQLVRHPETKESLHWDRAVEAAGETSSNGDYTAAVNYVADALRASFQTSSGPKPNETDLFSISILAIMHAEEQFAAPSAQY